MVVAMYDSHPAQPKSTSVHPAAFTKTRKQPCTGKLSRNNTAILCFGDSPWCLLLLRCACKVVDNRFAWMAPILPVKPVMEIASSAKPL